jgi:hypothetical protein
MRFRPLGYFQYLNVTRNSESPTVHNLNSFLSSTERKLDFFFVE